MKKALSSLLIVIILTNFIFGSVCYANTGGQQEGTGATSPMQDTFLSPNTNETTDGEPTSPVSNTAATDILEDGETSQKNGSSARSSTNSNMGGISAVGVVLGYLALMFDIIPLQFQIIFASMASTGTLDSNGNEVVKFWVTIERIVFNEIALFSVNYFNTDDHYTVGGENNADRLTIESSAANLAIKESITKMFMVCRLISIVASFLVLIYVGIRMALSTIATDKAKYQKMLVSWVESIVLLFLLHYIMIIVVNFGESLTNIFYDLKSWLVQSGGRSFEDTISMGIFDMITGTSGLNLAQHSIMYWILVFSQFKFLYLYMKRTLMTGFLIAIAPLITITYPIDKAGDGKAQAFGIWLKEFLFTVLIQPLHALIYLIFMFTAGAIAEYAPWVALLFMFSLGSAEKIVRTIFNITDMSTIGQINDFLKKKK